MKKILCSTGALIGRPNGRNYKLLKELKDKINCDGFEFMMYETWYSERAEVLKFILSLDLNIPVMHCEKSVGEIISRSENLNEAFENFKINCSMAEKLGAKKLVTHLWGGLPSDRNFTNNINAYKELKNIADAYKIELLIENVVCNTLSPMKRIKELYLIYPDIKFVFDTKMAQFHRELTEIYKEENAFLFKENRVKHIHLNDYKGEYMDWSNLKVLPVGEGDVDFKSFFNLLKEINYEGDFTLESTAFNKEGIVDTNMLNEEISLIKKKYLLEN